MTVVTLRPSATNSNAGTVIGAGGDADVALADDSDATYIIFNSTEAAAFALDDLSLPAGAVVTQVATRARMAILDDQAILRSTLGIAGNSTYYTTGVNWFSPTTVTLQTFIQAFTDGEVDAATLTLLAWNATLQIYEAYVDVTYVELPVVSVDTPTGTITENVPYINWSSIFDSDGGSPVSAELKLFTDAQYGALGFDPDTSTPYGQATILSDNDPYPTFYVFPDPLPNDTYRAYVRITQTVNDGPFVSEWDYSQFTVDAQLPGIPLLDATGDDDHARIRLDLTATASTLDTDQFQVQKQIGSEWVSIRTLLGGGIVDADDPTAWDMETTNAISTTYRARAINVDANAYSGWSATDTDDWASSSIWLKNPFNPDLNAHNPEGGIVRSFPSQSRDSGASVKRPLGAEFPYVLRDTKRIAESGAIIVMTETLAERDAIDDLLDSGDVLLLQFPPEADEPDRYIAPIGDHLRSRIVDRQGIHLRDETINWQRVAEPDGVIIAWPTDTS